MQVTLIIASLYGAKHAKAWHTNMPDNQPPPDAAESKDPRDHAAFKRREDFMKNDYAFGAEQSTKPQTIGYNLSDSPVGLLAWIYQPLVSCTDAYPWEDDEGQSPRSHH